MIAGTGLEFLDFGTEREDVGLWKVTNLIETKKKCGGVSVEKRVLLQPTQRRHLRVFCSSFLYQLNYIAHKTYAQAHGGFISSRF